MPIYEFLCQNCGHEFEQILPFSAQTTPNCPVCQSTNVVRRMGRPAIHFKGSGWYINDSKTSKDSANGTEHKSSEKSSPSTETATASSDTKSESKSESKSETKSDAKENRASTTSTS